MMFCVCCILIIFIIGIGKHSNDDYDDATSMMDEHKSSKANGPDADEGSLMMMMMMMMTMMRLMMMMMIMMMNFDISCYIYLSRHH